MYPDIHVSSDQNCYRASISLSRLQADPKIAPLISTFDFWMGPQHLMISAPSSDEDQYSMALYHPGNTGTAGGWKKPGDLEHMRETFKEFAPAMRKILDIVDRSVVWKVVEVPPLPSWISKGGKVVIIGDAAHGMTPYQGQVRVLPNVKLGIIQCSYVYFLGCSNGYRGWCCSGRNTRTCNQHRRHHASASSLRDHSETAR
jgi:salicylate hydroxylase